MEDTFPLVDVIPNPDWGLGGEHAYDIEKAQYKDGYTQRAPKGLFSRRRTFNPTWTMLDQDQKDQLVAFLDERKGCQPFWWETPEGEQVRVICEKGLKYTYDFYNGYTVTCTFEEEL